MFFTNRIVFHNFRCLRHLLWAVSSDTQTPIEKIQWEPDVWCGGTHSSESLSPRGTCSKRFLEDER